MVGREKTNATLTGTDVFFSTNKGLEKNKGIAKPSEKYPEKKK